MKNIINKIINFFIKFFIFSVFIIFIIIMFYIGQLFISNITNSKPWIKLYTIVSPSMEPKIKIYDMIVVTKVNDENSLKKGDIITFYSKYMLDSKYTITHRIYDIEYEDGIKYYITKGDNNVYRDEGRISFKDIEGKVSYVIPKAGRIQSFLVSKIGWILIVLIPSIIIILFDVIKLIKVTKMQDDIDSFTSDDEIK